MSKIPIDEQIAAADEMCRIYAEHGLSQFMIGNIGEDRLKSTGHALLAALKTLEFVRDHQDEIRYAVARKKALAEAQSDPAIQRVLEVFPEAQIEGVGEAD